MPRVAKPWYRASRRMWYGLHRGHQHPLHVTDPLRRDLAEEAYRKLLADLTARLAATPPAPAARTVADAAAEFLEKKKPPRVSPGCWRQYDFTLRVHLVPVFGSRPLTTLTTEEFEEWADRPAWSDSTRHNNLGTVMTLLKWAKCPLPIRRPPKDSRGASVVLSDEQFQKVLAAAVRGNYPGDLRELLRALRETGARPQEVATLTAESVDWGNACVRSRQHKGRRHTAERVIHLNTAAMAVLEAQRAKYGSGWLFRTRAGNAFSGPAIVKRMAKVSARVGFRAIAYSCRHSFATKALSEGISDVVVAELLGHRGTNMIHTHYSHVAQNSRLLKDAAERVNKAG